MNDEEKPQWLKKYQSPLNSRAGCMALISILVDRLGGEVRITQKDYDSVAYRVLDESISEIDSVFKIGKERNEPL